MKKIGIEDEQSLSKDLIINNKDIIILRKSSYISELKIYKIYIFLKKWKNSYRDY